MGLEIGPDPSLNIPPRIEKAATAVGTKGETAIAQEVEPLRTKQCAMVAENDVSRQAGTARGYLHQFANCPLRLPDPAKVRW
ncbi:MAG: hypothetical protein AW07_00896 [Candidatus Accumulibacter sp. SK-11]|nr:MAG: hypothetical protein AW07_00896 [Candidatus Accumulibacter sp. SK-11]